MSLLFVYFNNKICLVNTSIGEDILVIYIATISHLNTIQMTIGIKYQVRIITYHLVMLSI